MVQILRICLIKISEALKLRYIVAFNQKESVRIPS